MCTLQSEMTLSVLDKIPSDPANKFPFKRDSFEIQTGRRRENITTDIFAPPDRRALHRTVRLHK